MAEPGRVELTVLGQTLALRTEASPEYVRSLAAHVEERVRALQAGGVRDSARALVLAALEITDELFRAREDRARDSTDVGARLGALIELLEQVAPPPRPGARP
ncbi:MAG TPA: cell division protein ZapA [Methylomirabilota bacterium]|nr:cell division protein ZapA [Methylomirabilota bacterium]